MTATNMCSNFGGIVPPVLGYVTFVFFSFRLCVPRALRSLRHVHTSCASASKKTNRIFMRMEK